MFSSVVAMQNDQSERTFLFTDIAGSTQIWDEHPAAMRVQLARHDALLHAAAAAQGGHVFKTIGDAFCVAFATPRAAMRAAVDAQRALLAQDWGEVGTVSVRMAIHIGEVEMRDNDYFGPPLNRVARLRDVGHGSQILVSAAVYGRVYGSGEAVTFGDKGEHRLKDLAEPEHIYQVHAAGLPHEFGPLRSLSLHPNNLPAQTTSLVGRETEVREVLALLKGDARLVTITAFGGAGKTRLSLEVAEASLERCPQGVWFVDLASLSDPSLVMPTVARTCGLEENPAKTALQHLGEHFRSAHALLVLDNFEQVEAAADDVAQLLRACSQVQVLVTSRSLLNLSMEHEYALPPLRVPECMSLFASRARQVQSNFAVTNENRHEVEALCGRLDCMPLVVELAAAQVRYLSPGEIDRGLDLSTRRRDLPLRHRSLRGAIDWSYDLLSHEERRLFRVLSVFVGGFSAEAAEVVCGPACDDACNVFDMLLDLRDKSLIRLEREGQKRFTLLDSLRQYAAEQLAREDVATSRALRERHAAFYLQLVETQEPLLSGSKQIGASTTLEAEAANLRAGMDWMLDNGSLDGAARYGVALRRFWQLRGWWCEGQERLENVARRAEEVVDLSLRARLMFAAGLMSRSNGDFDLATDYYNKGLRLCEDVNDPRGVAQALNGLGAIAFSKGDLVQADRFYTRVLQAEQTIHNDHGVAMTLNNLGAVAFDQGQYERAQSLFTESLQLRERLGDERSAAWVWNHLGVVAFSRGRLEEAHAAFSKSHALCEKVGDPTGKAYALMNFGGLAMHQGDLDGAGSHYQNALDILRPINDKTHIAECLIGLGQVAARSGDCESAVRLCCEGLALHREIDDKKGIAADLEVLAEVAQEQKQPEMCLVFLAVASNLRDEIGARRTPHETERLADLERAAQATATGTSDCVPGLDDAIQKALAMAQGA